MACGKLSSRNCRFKTCVPTLPLMLCFKALKDGSCCRGSSAVGCLPWICAEIALKQSITVSHFFAKSCPAHSAGKVGQRPETVDILGDISKSKNDMQSILKSMEL